MSTPPSSGALKAARKLFPTGIYDWIHGDNETNKRGIANDQENVARIIDRETKVVELTAALSRACDALQLCAKNMRNPMAHGQLGAEIIAPAVEECAAILSTVQEPQNQKL